MSNEPQTPSTQGSESAAVAERPSKKPAPPVMDQLPPFRVLLHNDDVNELLYVVRSVMEVARLPLERAAEITLEAHEAGISLVKVCHRELAELHREQFESKGLTATIEPMA